MIERYIKEIIEAGKFLEAHPDWEPEEGWAWELEKMYPDKAIGQIVQELTED